MLKKILLLTITTLVFVACSSDSGSTPTTPIDKFDRGAMLTNLADNIIIPAYQDLDSKLGVLVMAKDNFITTTDQSNLDNLRLSWLNAYKIWQHIEMFNIGKAEEIQYAAKMNIYPTSANEIESNVASGSYDLTHVNNFDAIGFPALDYLLYGVESTDTAILEKYTTDTNATKYKTYLSDIVDQMESLTKTVLNDWTGSYRSTFIASTSNTATSAVNQSVNDFIFYYEKGLRALKFGIPAGNFSATPLPEKVEAFYKNDISKELSLVSLKAVKDIFNGKYYSSSSTGSSYNAYLASLNKSDLTTLINNQFDVAKGKIQALDNSFYNQINTDNTKMTQSYDALQAAVVLLKVDMLQAFNISVDYVDADGD